MHRLRSTSFPLPHRLAMAVLLAVPAFCIAKPVSISTSNLAELRCPSGQGPWLTEVVETFLNGATKDTRSYDCRPVSSEAPSPEQTLKDDQDEKRIEASLDAMAKRHNGATGAKIIYYGPVAGPVGQSDGAAPEEGSSISGFLGRLFSN